MTNYLGQQSCKWGWGEEERRLSLPCMYSLSGIRTVVFHAKLVQIQLLGTGLAFAAICGEKERRLRWITEGGSIYRYMFFILDFRISTDVSLYLHIDAFKRYFLFTSYIFLGSFNRYSLLVSRISPPSLPSCHSLLVRCY